MERFDDYQSSAWKDGHRYYQTPEGKGASGSWTTGIDGKPFYEVDVPGWFHFDDYKRWFRFGYNDAMQGKSTMVGMLPTLVCGLDMLGVMEDNPVVVTPGYILDRMNRLNAAMTTFQQDVWRALPGPTQPFSLAFGAFKMEWDKFYKDNGSGASGWVSRLSGSTMDSVINYERRLEEWKDKFRAIVSEQRKASPSSPAPTLSDPVTDPTNPQKKPPDEGLSTAAKIAIGVGVAGVGIGAFALLRSGISASPLGMIKRLRG